MSTAILLMTYRRPKNTERILKLLKKFNQKNLVIFNDGLKYRDHIENHRLTRNEIVKFKKENKIEIIFSKKNLTQKNNLPYALQKVFDKFDKAIILEDDCIPNKSFFKFCHLLLEKFENDSRIAQISGNNFLNSSKNFKRRNNDSYYFSKFTSSWGWATWKSRWRETYDTNMNLWPEVKKQKWLKDILQNKNAYLFWTKYFDRRYKMQDDDWDKPWTFVNFINNRLSIFPTKNLISNIGDDEYAIHKNPKKWDSLKLEEMKFPLTHPKIISQDVNVDNFLTENGFRIPKISSRLKNKIKSLFN